MTGQDPTDLEVALALAATWKKAYETTCKQFKELHERAMGVLQERNDFGKAAIEIGSQRDEAWTQLINIAKKMEDLSLQVSNVCFELHCVQKELEEANAKLKENGIE